MPSFLRMFKQQLGSIKWSEILSLIRIRLAFTWEWISFSNCLARFHVTGQTILVASLFLIMLLSMLGMSSSSSTPFLSHAPFIPLRLLLQNQALSRCRQASQGGWGGDRRGGRRVPIYHISRGYFPFSPELKHNDNNGGSILSPPTKMWEEGILVYEWQRRAPLPDWDKKVCPYLANMFVGFCSGS
jgi:hypothetical protein